MPETYIQQIILECRKEGEMDSKDSENDLNAIVTEISRILIFRY